MSFYSEILFNAIAEFIAVFIAFFLALFWDRKKEAKVRDESVYQIKSSLKSELNTNLEILRIRSYKIWVDGSVINIRPLRIAAWNLIAGREDLKYLPPSYLTKITDAYVSIINFNDHLSLWKSVVIYGKDRYIGDIDLMVTLGSFMEEEEKKLIETIEKATDILIKDSECEVE